METVYYISADDFCPCCKWVYGEYNSSSEITCKSDHCISPRKNYLYIQKGGKRPQDVE